MAAIKSPAKILALWNKVRKEFLKVTNAPKLPSKEEFPGYIAGGRGHAFEVWIESVLRCGRALILLDGVDVVGGSHGFLGDRGARCV